jgi:CBS-domain-containing membrane protein
VANPGPDSPNDEEISTAALLERNHRLNTLPVLDDEMTQLDFLVNQLNLDGETLQGDNYNVSHRQRKYSFTVLNLLSI